MDDAGLCKEVTMLMSLYWFKVRSMADIMPEYESSDEEKPKENPTKKDQGANLTGWN